MTSNHDGRMPHRLLGASGLRVPLFSLGGWLTIGGTVKDDAVKLLIKAAWDRGVYMIDTAECYDNGQSELEIGRVIRELDIPRTELVITTKIFFGYKSGPNETGLSRKHVIEGTRASLDRLGLDYVDIVFAHCPDVTVPMEETVRAFNWVIKKGWALYWATSEWSSRDIEEAYHVADKLGLSPPIAEQCQHNMFHRERPEKEYAPIYKKYSIGTTIWSPLASGLLSGKYNHGIPSGSRLDTHKTMFANIVSGLNTDIGRQKIEKVKQLAQLAEGELQCTVAQLALAWLAVNTNTSSVIIGASTIAQLEENLGALDVLPKLTPVCLEKIDAILQNKPDGPNNYGRPPLDPQGRSIW